MKELFTYSRVLYTIGYEKTLIDDYITILKSYNIQILFDVRCNNYSFFNKEYRGIMLKKICQENNIEYIHIPELGIPSFYRQNLKKKADYTKLFNTYYKHKLKDSTSSIQRIIDKIEEGYKCCLTCFEKKHTMCHRSHLSKEIYRVLNTQIEILHI